MKKIKKADIYLLIILLAVTALSYLLFIFNSKDAAKAVVRVDGVITDSYDLNVNGTYSLNGGTNILVIEDGSAYLIDADCPDKLCVKQGKINKCNQCITCLPNKLTVTIESSESEVDIIS